MSSKNNIPEDDIRLQKTGFHKNILTCFLISLNLLKRNGE